MYVSTSRGYTLPTSADDTFMPNLNSCIKSSQSSVTFPSVPPVCPPTTFVRNNVISKPITCRDSVIKCPRKCLRKNTVVKKIVML